MNSSDVTFGNWLRILRRLYDLSCEKRKKWPKQYKTDEQKAVKLIEYHRTLRR